MSECEVVVMPSRAFLFFLSGRYDLEQKTMSGRNALTGIFVFSMKEEDMQYPWHHLMS